VKSADEMGCDCRERKQEADTDDEEQLPKKLTKTAGAGTDAQQTK